MVPILAGALSHEWKVSGREDVINQGLDVRIGETATPLEIPILLAGQQHFACRLEISS